MKKLDEHTNVRYFSCGDNEWDRDIADFLIEDALIQQNDGLNGTYLCLNQDQIVGYTSLVASDLRIEESVRKNIFNVEIRRDHFPCCLIAQFGVAREFKRKGVGSYMVSFIRGAAITSEMGVKLLTLHVHKDNIDGRGFWTSMGFQLFKPASGGEYRFFFMIYLVDDYPFIVRLSL